MQVSLEPATPRYQAKHSTTEPLRFLFVSADYCVTIIQYMKNDWHPLFSSKDSMQKHKLGHIMQYLIRVCTVCKDKNKSSFTEMHHKYRKDH